MAFGANGSLGRNITGQQGFALPIKFGATGALLTSTSGFAYYIGGVNRSSFVATDSFSFDREVGGIRSARFKIRDKAQNYRPDIGQEFIAYFNGTRVFAGTIESTEEYFPQGSELLEVSISCAGYSAILHRRIVGKRYTQVMGGTVAITVAAIVRDFLDGEGIGFIHTGDPGLTLEEQVFNYITVHEAIKQVLDKANWDYEVDDYKNLRIFPSGSGKGACPFTITQPVDVWSSMTVKRSRGQYRNRQGVRNSRDVRAIWTDTWVGNAYDHVYPTTYPQVVKPVVKVNAVEKVVVKIEDIGTSAYDYYYILNGFGVFQNPSAAALGALDTLTVQYPSSLPVVHWTDNASEIAARAAVEGGSGKYEHVEEVKDVPDTTSLGQIASGLLNRFGAMSTVVSRIETREQGAEPGQLLTVNTTKPLANSVFMITRIGSQEEAGLYLKHTIEATSGQFKGLSHQPYFFGRMIQRDKQPLDRVLEHIGFILAETIEGISNPGLTTGLKQASRDAQKDGTCRECTLYFGSVTSVLTTTDVIVDILKNGVSIFGATKMVFPAGATSTQRQWVFASEPLNVSRLDKFTINVIQADSKAKDGVLQLTVIG